MIENMYNLIKNMLDRRALYTFKIKSNKIVKIVVMCSKVSNCSTSNSHIHIFVMIDYSK